MVSLLGKRPFKEEWTPLDKTIKEEEKKEDVQSSSL
jgi:hypothetical protein